MEDATVRRLSRLHRLIFKATRGAVGKRLVDNDMLLLSTRGRLTGARHTVPLLYLRDGDDYVVIASYGGRDFHPDWYLNLQSQPLVVVETRAGRIDAMARTMEGDERESWWDRVVDAYDGYATYQSRTEREIPIVALEPVG